MKILIVLFLYKFIKESYSAPVGKEITALLHLQQFGYLDEANNYRSGSSITEENVVTALKEFQRFAGLKETGVLDSETVTVMNAPRCGVKDIVGRGALSRKKRFALHGKKWRVEQLTYTVSKYPSRIRDKGLIDKEITRAFKVWSDAANINFRFKRQGRVNIDIRFEEGEHDCTNVFDGPNKTLAHAFFPDFGGDAHFDDEEVWTINDPNGFNIFQVAAHEFGHTLGLGHSDVKEALMFNRYLNYDPNFKLHSDDVIAIQKLYEPKDYDDWDQTSDTNNQLNQAEIPNLCKNATIDTITQTKDGSTYAFKGHYYWKIDNGIVKGYPRKISDDWDNLDGNLDASFTWPDGKTFFFKGNKYWKFINKEVGISYPKYISDGFSGIPDDIDAAFVWSGNGKTYFFKGDEYWKFDSAKDPPVSDSYPRPIGNWLGIPYYVDAAFQWEDSRTYFFKKGQYYMFNDIDFEVMKSDPPYPRSTAEHWFKC